MQSRQRYLDLICCRTKYETTESFQISTPSWYQRLMKVRLGVGCILDGMMFQLGSSSSEESGRRPWESDWSDDRGDNGGESMTLNVNQKEYD